MPTDAPLLEVSRLTVEFRAGSRGWVPVVDDVSLSIAAGEIVGLVGESGSGKTVTGLSMLGLLPKGIARIPGGQVNFNGRDLTALTRRELEDVRGNDIAMIFQEPMTSLNPAWSIGEQIAESVRRHQGLGFRASRRRAEEMLAAVGIPNPHRRSHEYPHEFSGGMRQRVLIAIALACEPRLLIADEPTTALDVTIQAQILELLKDKSAELGMAILLVTHDMGVVADMCDRVAVMYAGQVVETAGADALFDRPEHPYTDALLRSIPTLGAYDRVLPPIPGSPPGLGEAPAGCRFAPRCDFALPECTAAPVALRSDVGPGQVRCIRAHELVLEGAAV